MAENFKLFFWQIETPYYNIYAAVTKIIALHGALGVFVFPLQLFLQLQNHKGTKFQFLKIAFIIHFAN
jgi:nitrate/nitrite transporter NarK